MYRATFNMKICGSIQEVNNHSKSVDVAIFAIHYLRRKWLNYINNDIKAETWETIIRRRAFRKVSSTASMKCFQVGGLGRLSRSSRISVRKVDTSG